MARMDVLDVVRDCFFPPRCCVCGIPGSALCLECAPFVHERQDERLATSELALRCLGIYGGNLRVAILAIKQGQRDVARALACYLAERVHDLPWLGEACLVPIPTARVRVRLRGVDGAAYVARILARELGQCSRVMLGTRSQRMQHQLKRRERLAGTRRLYLHSNAALAGLSVVLVDDVVTTGATLREAAMVLRTAGARVDGALALARTL